MLPLDVRVCLTLAFKSLLKFFYCMISITEAPDLYLCDFIQCSVVPCLAVSIICKGTSVPNKVVS